MSWGARVVGLVLAGALALSGVVGSPARATPPDPCPGPLSCGDDLSAAMDLESKIADNTWYGQVFEIDYRTAARTPGDVASIGAFADSALWTGTYLASQAFRYELAKHYLAMHPLPGGDRQFWNEQKDQAKARADEIVKKFHMLVNISKNWQHQFAITLDPFGFGGGVFSGEAGYLMRACIPSDAPAGYTFGDKGPARNLPPPYTENKRVFGPLKWDDGKTYYCEDGTSRDAYAGTIFGLLLAFDLISKDDPAMRHQIRNDIVTLSNFAFKYLWNTPRPHGRVSIPLDEIPGVDCNTINAILQTCGHDFENFISPLFVITPTAQMEMTQAAYHVVTEDPGHPDATKWTALFPIELAATGPFLAFSELLDTEDPYGSYYKWNLEHLIAFNLVRMAPNDVAKTIYKQAIGVMDATTGNDVNAHFEAITYALTGEQSRLNAAITHLRQWKGYRTNIDAGAPTNTLGQCGTSRDCVPQDQLDVTLTPGAPVLTIPGMSTELRAHFPIAVADRHPTDFLWQRPPNQLTGPLTVKQSEALARHQAPGIDYLLPYWMIRYLTEVQKPELSPFPAWPGPSFN